MIEKLKLAMYHAERLDQILRSLVEGLPQNVNPMNHVTDDTPAFSATYKAATTPLNFVPTEATNPKVIVEEVEEAQTMTDREALISYTEEFGKAEALNVLALCGAKKLSDVKDSKQFRQLLGR